MHLNFQKVCNFLLQFRFYFKISFSKLSTDISIIIKDIM